MDLQHYFLLLVSTVLVNNVVLVRMLGLCPFMGVSRKLEAAIGMGAATAFVLTLASGSSHLINLLLVALDLEYLRTLSFIVVIAAIVQFTEMVIHKTSPVLYQSLGIYLPLITTNCAVLGVALLNVQEGAGFVRSVVYGLGSAAGFTMVMVLFAGLRERLALQSAADLAARLSRLRPDDAELARLAARLARPCPPLPPEQRRFRFAATWTRCTPGRSTACCNGSKGP